METPRLPVRARSLLQTCSLLAQLDSSTPTAGWCKSYHQVVWRVLVFSSHGQPMLMREWYRGGLSLLKRRRQHVVIWLQYYDDIQSAVSITVFSTWSSSLLYVVDVVHIIIVVQGKKYC